MVPIFTGCTIAVANCDAHVQQSILNNCKLLGAKICAEFTDACTHLITPLEQGKDYEKAIATGKCNIVSLQWYEDCMTAKQYVFPCKPSIHFPIRGAHGIEEMRDLTISVTGFVGEERNDLKYLIKISGAKYSGTLSKKENTHLICNGADGEKYKKALEWEIHVVTKRWLLDCLAAWSYLPEKLYRDVGML